MISFKKFIGESLSAQQAIIDMRKALNLPSMSLTAPKEIKPKVYKFEGIDVAEDFIVDFNVSKVFQVLERGGKIKVLATYDLIRKKARKR
jgi:hypothetical protein